MLPKFILKNIYMLKKLLVLVMLCSSLLSNVDFVNLYKNKGINAVEKLINKKLIQKEYWQNKIKNKNLRYGYYESHKQIVICSKDLSDIQIYDTKDDKYTFTTNVITGEKYGNKYLRGDLKTPVGVYKLTNKLTKLDQFYGPFALVTNYPNEFDKSLGKTGDGIWIHGVPFKGSRNPYTKGCIVIQNDNLKILDSSIDLKKSLLMIREDVTNNADINEISLILSELFKWRNAWKFNDFEKYISFYSNEFKRTNGTNLTSFTKYKKSIFQKNEKKIILFRDINVILYPNDLNKVMYKISMDEYYKTKTYKFEGSKVLYVEILNGKMKILLE